jgi:aryl-alcohol dehydrogenase-like predicted oxidoreductase
MYWDRMRAMDVRIDAASALGFVLAQPEISAALVGTTSLAHLRSSIEIAQRSDATETVTKLRAAFRRCDQGWDGII